MCEYGIVINNSDLFSRDYLLSYCLESLSYSAWFTMCLTYRRLSLKLMKAIRRRLFPPISMTHHLSLCVKLSSDGNTFLRSSGRLKVPLHKTLYVRSIAAASFGYLAAASRKGFLDITCNIFPLPKVSFLETMRETLSLCQDGTSYAAKKRVPLQESRQGGGSSLESRFQRASLAGGVNAPHRKRDRSEGHVPLETDALFGVGFQAGSFVLKRQVRGVECQLVAMAGKEPVEARCKFLAEVSPHIGVRIDV